MTQTPTTVTPTSAPTTKDPRRHDLDALRAFAMLLGIFLHAALSFMPESFWMVQDERTSGLVADAFWAIHGFRMPLFFLISGFFTAMLWKRRGLHGLIKQRTFRIAIPLSVGVVTIVPLMWSVYGWVARNGAEGSDPAVVVARDATIWSTAGENNADALRVLVEQGADVNAPDEMSGTTPLGWAAVGGAPEAAAALLELGADPNLTYGQGSTPMHTAVFLGRVGVAEHLLNADADLTIVDGFGSTSPQGLDTPEQITMMIVGFLQIEIGFEEIKAGREEIREMLASRGIEAEGAGLKKILQGLMDFPFFNHLWFLWFLCWLVAGFAIAVSCFRWVPLGKIPGVLIGTPLSLVWLVPLTMTMQWFMGQEGTVAGFGPDTSAGVIPMPHVLGYYAIFFGFGAMVYSRQGAADRLGRGWWLTLPLAIAILPPALALGLRTEWGFELAGDETTLLWMSALGQVLFVWLMSFGLMGLFETVLSKERRWVRYVSDSSYWLYLVHLPLVIMAQWWISDLDAPWWVKLGGLTVGTSVVLLISYQLFVRHTPIGWMLNGRRKKSPASPVLAETLSA